jgi:transposase
MRAINILVIPPFRIIAFRKGRVAAIIATAKKIAIIIWNMIINNEPYSSYKLLTDNENYEKKRLRNIQRILIAST